MIAPVDMITSVRCRNRCFDSPGYAGLNDQRPSIPIRSAAQDLAAPHQPAVVGTIVRERSGGQGGLTKALTAFFAALAGSAVLGIAAGLIWAAVAPRAVLEEIARGEAELVNAESSAFIAADGWFCLIAAVGGLITGILGYWLLVRRAGWPATAGLVLGAVAAALLAMWVGENIGLGTYNHLLASSPNGTFFNASLALGAKSALAFWPLLTSAVILLAETGTRRSDQAAGRRVRRDLGPDGPL
jgi:hypothetical protein